LFLLQALVNIAWGFATMMGEVCAAHSLFKQLFLQIRHEAIMRWVGFVEQIWEFAVAELCPGSLTSSACS
jgi:hypothetical protein